MTEKHLLGKLMILKYDLILKKIMRLLQCPYILKYLILNRGISHDEDFRERSYLNPASSSISVLIGKHSYSETLYIIF